MKRIFTIAFFVAFAMVAFAQKTLTFRVDMSLQTVDPAGVTVAGDFQGAAGGTNWTPGQILLTDDDGNMIWEATATFADAAPGDEIVILYKYINGATWGPNEGIAGTLLTDECSVADAGGNINRTLTIPAGDAFATVAYQYDSCTPTSIIGTNDLTTAKGAKLTPNPMTNSTVLSFENLNGTAHTVTVKNMVGQTVATYSNVLDNVTINRNNLTSGIYFVVVSNNRGELSTQKLIVE